MNRAQRRALPSSGLKGTPLQLRPPIKGGVVIAYPHPVGEVSARFHTSLIDLIVFDRDGGTVDGKRVGGNRRVAGHMPLSSGANIVTARNKIVKTFLEGPWASQPEWLWFIDSDMTFNANTLDMLLASADPKERPIVGGLCFALMKGEAQEIVPTVYGVSTQNNQLVRYTGYPPDRLVQVAGTGAACLLVHRSVLETLRDARWTAEEAKSYVDQGLAPPTVGDLKYPPPWPWFQETITGFNWGDSLSEDLTFCLRAAQCGYPIFVDTRVKTGHVKPTVIDEERYFRELPSEEEPAPTFVTIPVKGNHELTRNLLGQLREQGGYEHIFLYDNGADTDPLPEDLYGDDLTVFNAAGYRFHRMWNDGIRQSIARHTRCNIAILNNDLELGSDFLTELARGLRVHPQFLAVCGNYDNRDFPEIVQGVRGIAAGREDGTGGFAGFGFMLRGEACAAGMLFDEQFEFWYGDNDLLLSIEAAGGTYGIVKNARMKHLGGGSQTSRHGTNNRLGTPELQAMAERDRVRFEKKWAMAQVPA